MSKEPDSAEVPSGGSAGDAAPELSTVLTVLEALSERLDRERDRAAHREAVIDRLHEENQRLRRGELDAALEPLRIALYRVHDRARREAAHWSAAGSGADLQDAELAGKLAGPVLQALADDVVEALARTGVARFTATVGERFDATRHRALQRAAVADPTLDGTVHEVLGDGFERDGRVVRKADVGVALLSPGGSGCAEPGGTGR